MSMDRSYTALIAGVDEVGRGPLAGPVVACAVILDPNNPIAGLADSKKLSEKRREELSQVIQQKCLSYALGVVDHEKIDQINILQASLLAMRQAVLALHIKPAEVLVDGNKIPELPYPAIAIIKGDSKIAAISAASIVAKVYRDHLMMDFADTYPGYGFAQHKGYPTREHIKALMELGVTPIHRRSYAPVSKVLVELE